MICPHCQQEINIEEPIHQKKTKKLTYDFEPIYKLYPRKQGKLDGIKKCRSQIKTDAQFEELKKAVQAFVRFHQQAGTEPQFIPYFSTFMSSWQEWLLPETGSVRMALATGSETTAQYLDRLRIEKEQEEKWETPDPERVKAILSKAMSNKGM